MRQILGIILLALVLMPESTLSADVQNPYVVIETNLGNMVVELYPQAAPITVDNFLFYANTGFYDNLLFHRVMPGFMIQGGGCYYYNSNFYFPETNDPIINESYNGLSNVRGTIAMARTAEPHSATSEFFINHVDNLFLDRENAQDGYGYCVFGRVVEGMDVADAIAVAPIVDLRTYNNPSWPPYTHFPNPLIGMYEVYVLPNEFSYESNFSGDSSVNLADFAVFASNWLEDQCRSANTFCGGADLDYSGNIDIMDLDLFVCHWDRMVGYEPQASDINSSRDVDLEDLAPLASNWLNSACAASNDYCDAADLNRDGTIDLADFALFSGNWLLTY